MLMSGMRAIRLGRKCQSNMIRIFSSQEERDLRQKICNDCEYKDGVRCGICGCFLIGLRKIEHAKCPMGKWQTKDNGGDT